MRNPQPPDWIIEQIDRLVAAVEGDDIAWGSVAEWVGAVGTVLAFGVAAAAYVASVLISRKAQARRVHIVSAEYESLRRGHTPPDPSTFRSGFVIQHEDWGGGRRLAAVRDLSMLTVTVANTSDEIIGPIRFDIFDNSNASLIPDESPAHHVILPGQSWRMTAIWDGPWPFGDIPSLTARIVFRDASGNWWQRLNGAAVQRAGKAVRGSMDQMDISGKTVRVPAPPDWSGEVR